MFSDVPFVSQPLINRSKPYTFNFDGFFPQFQWVGRKDSPPDSFRHFSFLPSPTLSGTIPHQNVSYGRFFSKFAYAMFRVECRF